MPVPLPDENDSDEVLMGRIALGDQVAFHVLFTRRTGDVFKLCYSLLLNRQAAEDVTQESFFKLWIHAKSWRPEARVKTWLLTIARNGCLDYLRKKNNDRKKHEELYKTALTILPLSQKNEAENSLDRKKQEKILEKALFSLPERQREAVTLVYYSEVHNIDAARIMGMKPAAFDSLLARARRNLRTALDEDEEELRKSFIQKSK